MSAHRQLQLAATPLAIAILCTAMPAADTSRWARIRGVNFFTSSASNANSMWRHFDPAVADRELGWMEALGFNSVRLWLSEPAWREQPAAFLDALGRCLDLCAKHRLSALLVLFDSCGIEPRAGAVEMTVAEAYAHFLKLPDLPEAQKNIMQARYVQFASGRGRLMRVPVARDTPPDILFWQHWTPNPGLSRLGAEHWPELDAYTAAVMALAARRPAVIAVDAMNEPYTLMDLPPGASYRAARDRVDQFIAHISARLHSRYPAVERTIGSADFKDLQALARYQTLLSIHSYQLGDDLARTLGAAATFAREAGKPILLTECLANTDNWLRSYGDESLSTDEGQLRHYQRTLPLILNSRLGWYAWAGITGHMFTPTTDIMYSNGYLRPAALYLQRQLSGAPEDPHP
jgi:hypothetical protein